MTQSNEVKTLWTGSHLSMVARGHWEFATRKVRRPAVGIVALTANNHVVLVEQHRPPVNRRVVEIPAGLAGDIAGAEQESPLDAARRELLEETGYTANRWTQLITGYSSPGMTDESIILFLAEDLTKTGTGGGDGTESIQLHEVPLDNVPQWLAARSAAADLKLLAGLYAAQHHLSEKENNDG